MKKTNEKSRMIIVFEQTLDTRACNELEEELIRAMDDCESNGLPVVFDLTEVDFIASSFLRLCMKASRQLGSENVSIVNVAPPIKKVFKIAGFTDYLSIC